ncbi:MAG: spermidine synthase, partial [Vampirovibrionia bacterium]
MIISTYIEDNNYLHSEDERKLLAIEKADNVIYEYKSDYNNISIIESCIGRILLFDDTYQGGNIKYNGYYGGMPYTRYYHMAKSINNNIKNILILGLGSGSVVKDCIKIYDYQSIDIIDIDSYVIDAAYKYFDLPENDSVKVFCEDARDYIFYTNKLYDLIIVDVFVAKGMPYKFMTKEFISQAFNILTNEGIIGVNLFGTDNLSDPLNDIFKSEYKTYNEVFSNL